MFFFVVDSLAISKRRCHFKGVNGEKNRCANVSSSLTHVNVFTSPDEYLIKLLP